MDINKKQSGNTLTVAVSGRLDTITAPELEKELNASYEGISELILDFVNLEYISSAGLRVVLAAQKKMLKQGELVICNVNADIKEVFDITGFSDFLTIR